MVNPSVRPSAARDEGMIFTPWVRKEQPLSDAERLLRDTAKAKSDLAAAKALNERFAKMPPTTQEMVLKRMLQGAALCN